MLFLNSPEDTPGIGGDGICVFVGPEAGPDYKIISIKPEYSPKVMELERII